VITLEPVRRELLEALANEGQKPKEQAWSAPPNGHYDSKLKVGDWLRDRGVGYRAKKEKNKGRTVYVLEKCPLNPDHGDPDSCIMQSDDGRMGAKCLHDSCAGKGWQEFKNKIGKPDAHHYDPPLSMPAGRIRHDEPKQGAAGAEDRSASTLGFRWEPIDSAAFAAADYQPEWYINQILVANQPTVIGGPYKVLKTSFVIDMGISIAFGRPWLGLFACPRPRRVAILSGESGAFTLQETAKRVCAAKGISLADLKDNLRWQFTLPQFSRREQLEQLHQGLVKDRIEVLVTDPLYLSLLAGGDVRAENLFEMGPLFLNIAATCQRAGATPVLCHHTKRGSGRDGEPLELSDLAYSGVAEFARQWLLLSRRKPYESGTGRHELWLNVGGSVGHSGLWAVDVEEGVIGDDFRGRKWDVSVQRASEARETAKAAKTDAKAEEGRQKDRKDETGLLAALQRLDLHNRGVAYVRVQDLSGLSRARMRRAFERLVADRIVERCTVKAKIGSGAERDAEGIRRAPENKDTPTLY
jgi:RecA-family ATPase